MNSFNYYNPVKIFFGTNAIQNLENQIREYNNILITYGGGSIKKNGIYDSVMSCLAGKNVVELSGIMPNPRTEKVYEGIRLCKENHIEFILAVGGGSVIDCTKFIAAGAKTEEDFWKKFFINQEECEDALPLGTVLTLAGTGSEMNCGGVITNWEDKIKTSYGNPALYPKFSILDPTYTYSLPKEQLISGTIDILSHIFEIYFSAPDTSNVSDDIAEALIKSVIENLNVAIKNPTNYTARANLMWNSSMALNGIIEASKEQDWMTHQIEHTLSAFYDIPHGMGLAIVHPNYMKYVYKNAPAKFARYAKNIWGVNTDGKNETEVALEGIERTKEYFKTVGAPTTLQEVSIPKDAIKEMAEKTNRFPTSYSNLGTKDIVGILELCLE